MRINEHPILEEFASRRDVPITLNGAPAVAKEGDTVASALLALGVTRFRLTRRFHEPRGPFCFIGRCTDCEVTVDGKPGVKACVTLVREGMNIEVPGGIDELPA